MTYASLFTFARKTAAPPPHPVRPDTDRAAFVANLIAALLDRAAGTRSFRGAIPSHPGIAVTPVTFGSDEGTCADLGLAAIATTTSAAITVTGTDASRLGFLTVSPLHKQTNGYDPDWSFDDPEAAMTALIRIRGLDLEVACINDPGGAATIVLTLSR